MAFYYYDKYNFDNLLQDQEQMQFLLLTSTIDGIEQTMGCAYLKYLSEE